VEFTLAQMAVLCGLIFLGGFVDSVAGGGGLITLPAYFAMGLPAHAALATNKFSSVCGTFTAVIRYWRAGAVNLRVGLAAAAGALAGSVAGAKIALIAPASTINTVMLVLVPSILVFMLVKDRLIPEVAGFGIPGSRSGLLTVSVVIGLVIGVYDGFFGPGTGTFLTIAFSVFLGFGLLSSAGNARLANLASNVGAVAVFLWNGQVVFPLALYAAGAGIAGNLLGARLAVRNGARIIKPLMTVVMVLLLAEVVRRRFF